jgi:hypothetical protein
MTIAYIYLTLTLLAKECFDGGEKGAWRRCI